jgi:hypothetical protein
MVILAVPLGILGANTLEYMCHYAPPQTWYFIYPQKFAVSYWNAYFFGGMLPYACSFLLFGIVMGYMLKGRKNKMKYALSIDPPKWKVWVGFIVIVLSDLYVGIQSLEESASGFQLGKAVMLLLIHAFMFGFIFLQKEEETKTEEKKQ